MIMTAPRKRPALPAVLMVAAALGSGLSIVRSYVTVAPPLAQPGAHVHRDDTQIAESMEADQQLLNQAVMAYRARCRREGRHPNPNAILAMRRAMFPHHSAPLGGS